ncbi:hypothetical protein L195_g034500 [Trifolium pratense]|uniref:Uncharacterized protein n=1 Tax=Trifolium pratense TaxID=57577 RepID=A0A2K3LJ23_TRIPR|nr:hypothetical protein L195_g034500 [Trifolium pratense]
MTQFKDGGVEVLTDTVVCVGSPALERYRRRAFVMDVRVEAYQEKERCEYL